MLITSGSRVLLQTASILALSTGLAFAQSESNQFNNEDVPDAPPGFVFNSNEAEISGEAEGAAGTLTTTEELVGRQPAADDEMVPDVEPGAVTDREMFMDDTTAAALAEWKLADYQGAELRSDIGDTVGTIEGLAYDDGQRLYLIVKPAPDLDPVGEGSRAVPLDTVAYNSSLQALVVDEITIGTIEAMAPLDTQASGFTAISTDAQLTEMTGTRLQGSSDINSN